jgi:hypothetical protein
MNLNRKRVLAGLAATGITVGALAGGGVAVASTGPAQVSAAPTATASPTQVPCGNMHGHHHGAWGGKHSIGKAIAGYLGLSSDQLRSKLESGQSLADVAKAQGKPVSGLESTIVTAITSRINAAGNLSADQKSTIISEVKSHIGDLVNATCSPSASPMPGSGSPSGSPGGS